MKDNWTLKNGTQTSGFSTFPYAYRTAYFIVQKAKEDKKNISSVMKDITIVGPPNLKGERNKYSYASATQLATENGLLSADGRINSKEFKNR